MRRTIATVCLSGTLEDKLVAAAAAGFDGVEIFENDLVVTPLSPAEIRARCADLGLSVDLYQPFRDFEAVPPDLLAANLRRAERKFDVMADLGADTMLVCSSVSPDAVDDDDLAAEQLHLLAERAAARGLRIAYEALAWGRFVDTYDHSWRIVRRGDHPALGVCLDSFHVLSRGTDLHAIRTIPGEKVFFLQLADAPRLDMDVLQWSRHHRLFPGQGAFDLGTFLAHVLSTGYAGPLSLEVFNDVFRQSDPRRAAIDGMRSLQLLEEHRLPPAPGLAGHAFTELGVSGAEIGAALEAMGFAQTGRHPVKPVELWQQGGARVLLNSSSGEGEVSALGVASSNPAASMARAAELHAPALTGVSLPGVTAPDGTAVFFCADGWLNDFEPTGKEPDGTGLTGTDHVSLTQPFDNFDEAALFYRTVLGLQPDSPTELAAPFGLIRSRSASDPEHGVRISLNAALLRRGDWAPGVLAPQHIAFTSEDVLATAKEMQARGAPLLKIPANYYDDLDARLAPPPDLLAALREYSVLYDRDELGEFLHCYTEVLGARVFFEVVQRLRGYAGYGSANAPVRMAAHRRLRLARD